MNVKLEGKTKDVSIDELLFGAYLVSEQLKLHPIEYGRTYYGTVFGNGLAVDYHVSRKANLFITVEQKDLTNE